MSKIELKCFQEEEDFHPVYEELESNRDQAVPAYLILDPAKAITTAEGPLGNVLSAKGKPCSMCGKLVAGKFQRHLGQAHLPWYLSPFTACWSCRKQEDALAFLYQRHHHTQQASWNFDDEHLREWLAAAAGFLFTFTRIMGKKQPGELLNLIVGRQLFESYGNPLPPQVVKLYQKLEEYLGLVPVAMFSFRPPNAVPCLLHWSVLKHALPSLSSKDQQALRESFTCMSPAGEPLPVDHFERDSFPKYNLVDSHCHLIHTLDLHHASDLNQLKRKAGRHRPSELDFNCAAMINNVAHPSCWRSWRQVENETGIFQSFGMHPLANDGISEETLRAAAAHPSCVAIGECGYDLSRTPYDKREEELVLRRQQSKLRMQLLVAKDTDKAVVIHVRGREGDQLKSYRKLQERLVEDLQTILPRSHRIHFHCFIGAREDYELLSSKFPGAKFGFTHRASAPEVREVARIMRPEHLLLESDAPFLTPLDIKRVGSTRHNSPFFLDYTLKILSRFLNIPTRILAGVMNENAREVYRLPGMLQL